MVDYSEDYMGIPGLTYEMYQQMVNTAAPQQAATSPATTQAITVPSTSTISSSPTYPTVNIAGVQITAPESFGLTAPKPTLAATTPAVTSTYTSGNIGNQTVTAPSDFGIPSTPTPAQTTESGYVQGQVGQTTTGTTGTTGTNTETVASKAYEDVKRQERQSAYDLLFQQFSQYGLGALVEPLKGLVQQNISPSEFTLKLRETEPYKARFAANAQRIKSGLRALSEAEYIGLEDEYQNVMRRYGMPESYYKPSGTGVQSNFEKFIAGDVSAAEVEDRIQAAQDRVINANPEVAQALKTYYPGITNGDILGYVLDPTKDSIKEIQRKITAAEIGGAATQAGFVDPRTGLPSLTASRATELANAGVTKESAQKGYQAIAGVLPRGEQLADIYKQSPYTRAIAEQEVFGLSGATEAEKQRKKLAQLEQASFLGQAGRAGGALSRERSGQY